MNWTVLLQKEIEHTYETVDKLLSLVDEDKLTWKPSTGSNWMTTAQLMMHITISCGAPMRCIVTDDWGMPEDMDINDIPPEEMLPPAEKLPAIESVAEARRFLVEDKQIALEILAQCSEEDLTSKPAPVPWDKSDMNLGHRLLGMIEHLKSHKSQLFYYLKLQGKPVNTNHLWGG
jgi:uncharacterized damage-inducible protein DinB